MNSWYCNYFKNKKITLMGLGLLGRGVGDARFLASCGAKLTITDLKSAESLRASIKKLAGLKNTKFNLGGHRMEDFKDADFILKAAGVPLDSLYIKKTRENGIPVEMDASLFVKLARQKYGDGVKIVGVTGTRGKSTTTQLIYEILKKSTSYNVWLAGNVRGAATLPFLKKIRPGDIVVLELDSWQLQGFDDSKISPDIAVFTSFFDDHLNYYKGDREQYLADKANIFLFQHSKLQATGYRLPCLIVGSQAAPVIKKFYPSHAKRAFTVNENCIPKNWKLNVPGVHYRYNAALALAATEALCVKRSIARAAISSFRGLAGRLEYLRAVRGVKIYNDTCATTPEATIAALKALGDERKKNIVLIMGGADKNLNMNALIKEMPKYCKRVIFLPGTGTDKLIADNKKLLKSPVISYPLPVTINVVGLKQAVREALNLAKKGNIILFSPAFASFGMFKNEYDRGDKFEAVVKLLH